MEKQDSFEWLISHCSIHKYNKNSFIVLDLNESKDIYIIIEGSAKKIMKDHSGLEMISEHLYSKDFFGELNFFGFKTNFAEQVKISEASVIAKISYDRFKNLQNVNEEIKNILIKGFAEKYRNIKNRNCEMHFYSVTERVYQIIRYLSKQKNAMTHPQGMQIKITRQEIGMAIGCTRETVGRSMKILEEKNLISSKGKTIVVFRKPLQSEL